MSIHQLFCTVADLIADMEKPGGDETRLLQAIRDASDVLQKEIGWFIPVTQTTKLRGSGERFLHPHPPVLALTGSVTEDSFSLTLDTEFSLCPAAWPNGPSVALEKRYGYNGWSCLNPDSIQIPSRAGLFEKSKDTGATVQNTTSQDASTTSLVVSNGGKIALGMILLIGSEQELVTEWGATTVHVTDLNGAITASTDILTVVDGNKANIGEIIRAEFEQMRVKDIRSNQWYVDRGWNNTGAVTHADGTDIDVYRTVTVERAINGTTAAAHTTGTAISRYVAPDDVVFLTKQIATLMINKARGNYAGKTGNPELGEVYYHDVFPRYEIERVKANYMLGKL